MDNRFKFRAWAKDTKRMAKVLEMDCKYNMVTFYNKDGDLDIYPTNGVILMQCSTLQDKHGVEIYEGDICRDSAGHEYIIGFTPLEGFYRAPIKEQHHRCTLKNHRDLTVVGNVYEGRFNDTVCTVDYVDRTGSEPHPYKVYMRS